MIQINNNLPDILAAVINQKGIPKEEIALEVGVSPMTVYRWKTNQSFPKSKAVYNSLLNYLEKVQNG